MCALRTPCFSADTHDSSFGIMPSEILPSAISCSMPPTSMREISDVSSGQSPYTPATSVRYTSFSASSASAIAPATVSAFTLYAWPSSSTPTVAITGISSSRSMPLARSWG